MDFCEKVITYQAYLICLQLNMLNVSMCLYVLSMRSVLLFNHLKAACFLLIM